ncbi:polyhydroxyalkanoate granule-associated phasin [Methylolobus aquaticus]
MTRHDATRLFNPWWASSTPVTLWWQTWLKATETMIAAPQVVAHRTALMAQVRTVPNRSDQRELTTMSVEKVVAFSQAGMNAASELVAFQQQMANSALRQWWVMAHLCNPMTAFAVPWRVMNAPVELLSASHRALSITPRVAHGAVKPIHAKATSNARRLARKRR